MINDLDIGFLKSSSLLKKIALNKFISLEYSLLLYLIDYQIVNSKKLDINFKKLSQILSYNEINIRNSILRLSDLNIINFIDIKSDDIYGLSMNLDIKSWKFYIEQKKSIKNKNVKLLDNSVDQIQEDKKQKSSNINIIKAKEKHYHLDNQLKLSVKQILEKKDIDLNEEEINILKIIINHKSPRRQLFWAYQNKLKYPNLSNFFKEHQKTMIPVTSSGKFVKPIV